MNTMYAETAKLILNPNRFSLTKAERDGKPRWLYRAEKRAEKNEQGAKYHSAGTVCENANYKKMAKARTHYENIGLGISLRCPLQKAFKTRYRGGSWNK